MLIDALVSFVPIGAPLSLIGGDGVGIPSQVIDLLGLGQGVAPSTADFIGDRTIWGEDAGVGKPSPQVEVLVTTALTTGNAATLNVAFQGALEDATTHLPGTWRTLVETGYMAVADLGLGAVAARFDFPPSFPVNFMPRFLRLLFQPLAATHFTAGAVLAPVTMVRDDQANRYTPKNYKVGPLK